MSVASVFRRRDDAVSPVIGIILMVAITVVLAGATMQWASGFGNVPQQPIRVLSLASEGPVQDGVKEYLVSGVVPGLLYQDVVIMVDDVRLDLDEAADCPPPDSGTAIACRGERTVQGSDAVTAGDHLFLNAQAGQTLRILDPHAGAVLLVFPV